jgi:hypothetical protein
VALTECVNNSMFSHFMVRGGRKILLVEARVSAWAQQTPLFKK